MISLKLTGIERLNKAMKDKNKALTSGVDAELTASVLEINAVQKQRAPVDFGLLRSSLKTEVNKNLDKSIVSTGPGSSYAPYQEFGTGGLVSIPAELTEEAAQFKGKGIRKVNMRAQPFFFAPAFEEWPKFVKRVKDMLK